MHTSGVLKQIVEADKVDDINFDRSTLKAEEEAITEVYNYAARFGLLPQLSIRRIERPHRAKRAGYEVTLTLPEQEIQVSGRGMFIEAAHIAACIKFKDAAEEYQAHHGDSSIVIRDQTALTTTNLKNFWDYLKLRDKAASLKVECHNVKGYKSTSGNVFEGKAFVQSSGSNQYLEALGGKRGEAWTQLGDGVIGYKKKTVEDLTNLVAAVKLCEREPDLLTGFQKALSVSGSGILMPVKPVTLSLSQEASYMMQDTLRDARRAGLPTTEEEIMSDEEPEVEERVSRQTRLLDGREKLEKNKALKEQRRKFEEDSALAQLREKRAALPMSQYRDQVLQQVKSHNYSVIVGATGSGKTTQVPQILLDDAISNDVGAECNIVCTQPRRIAATSVARRVAEERNEALQKTVGYHVRFDPKRPRPGGSITYCTTGILLQQLQTQPDEVLDRVSHIVIDEVHERDILIDFLMIIVKSVAKKRKLGKKSVPKVVLMSATIDSELFGRYFREKQSDGTIIPCPSLSVPGRTFPVADKYLLDIISEMKQRNGKQMKDFLASDPDTKEFLNIETTYQSPQSRVGGNEVKDQVAQNGDDSESAEAGGGAGGLIDWKRERKIDLDGSENTEKEDGLIPINLIAATIMHICQTTDDGAILVFLPGYDEMRKTDQILRIMRSVGFDVEDQSKYRLHMLHSSVPSDEQAKVFDKLPTGCRRIILSTNIAETSVTIPDVQFVVDTGKLREKRYDQIRRITKLQCTWISKSNAKQRAGRAGRVQNGHYYALYSYERSNDFRAIGLPEMLRSDLQEICLDIKAQKFKAPIRNFLAQAIEPPAPAAVDASVANLQTLQALTEDENLTALGRLLASLPVHPSLGKMIILGVIFRCLDPMIVLGSALAERSIFVTPPERRKEAQRAHLNFLEATNSDHYALIRAYKKLRTIRLERNQRAATDFAFDNFLHWGGFKSIDGTARQIEDILVDAGLIPRVHDPDRFEGEFGHPTLNTNSTNTEMIKALALAGTHPNLAVSTGRMIFRTPGEKNAMIHPSSMNYPRRELGNLQFDSGMLYTYSTMAKSNDGKSTFLRDTTLSTPLMAALFGGRLSRKQNIIEMEGWLPFYVRGSSRDASLLTDFRGALDRLLTKSFEELSAFKKKRGEMGASVGRTYLADDEMRKAFESGLSGLLKLDVDGASNGNGAKRYALEEGGKYAFGRRPTGR